MLTAGAKTRATVALTTILATGAVALSAPAHAATPAMPDTGTPTTSVPDLVNGDFTLRMGNAYTITTCSASSSGLSLFVLASNGRWLKVAASSKPTRSTQCPYTGSPWLQTFTWTVNQVGAPQSSDGPNELSMAIGVDTPRSKFTAGVWPAARPA